MCTQFKIIWHEQTSSCALNSTRNWKAGRESRVRIKSSAPPVATEQGCNASLPVDLQLAHNFWRKRAPKWRCNCTRKTTSGKGKLDYYRWVSNLLYSTNLEYKIERTTPFPKSQKASTVITPKPCQKKKLMNFTERGKENVLGVTVTLDLLQKNSLLYVQLAPT